MTGFIGGGNMAEALIKGMKKGGTNDIIVSEPLEARRRYLEQGYGVRTTQSNKEAVSLCDIIILAVKPQNMDGLLDEISDVVTAEKTVVSIAAGITLSFLESRLRTKKLIRVMPNTPALVQEGMSVMSLYGTFYEKEAAVVRGILMSVGKVLTMPEEHMNSVTALSGSGPGFIALFTEALIGSGVKMGIDGKAALELVVQTLLGTAKMLDSGISPENLRKMVTSPGGTTAAGLEVFADRAFSGIVEDALLAARKRAGELGRRE
ncbi:MAG: pyrroline-5-carboxylate reductase [Nitrospirota bacterium]|nr:pyrroline-5-carboxylate reductase [Nitrospirota bacterium]